MEQQDPTEAPPQFLKILKKELARSGLSLRKFAGLVDLSPAYVSRLLNKERGAPSDEVIRKMEKALCVEEGALMVASGRLDSITSRVMRKTNARLLMRTIAPLGEKDLEQLLEVANQLAAQHKGGKSEN